MLAQRAGNRNNGIHLLPFRRYGAEKAYTLKCLRNSMLSLSIQGQSEIKQELNFGRKERGKDEKTFIKRDIITS